MALSIDSRSYLTVVLVTGRLDDGEAVAIGRAVGSRARMTDRIRIDLSDAVAELPATVNLMSDPAAAARSHGFMLELRAASAERRRALGVAGLTGRVELV